MRNHLEQRLLPRCECFLERTAYRVVDCVVIRMMFEGVLAGVEDVRLYKAAEKMANGVTHTLEFWLVIYDDWVASRRTRWRPN